MRNSFLDKIFVVGKIHANEIFMNEQKQFMNEQIYEWKVTKQLSRKLKN